ncbi:MAG TPA: carboxylate-amine ligase [Actinomycetota bacterium]|nr:carboxylate-amine ligase [Actinomycetota bacterium]
MFTVGIEEEFHIVDPETRQIAPDAERILSRVDGDVLEPELQKSQVETGTAVCETLDDVRQELKRLRHEASQAAEAAGRRLAASGTHPMSDWRTTETFPKHAYLLLERNYQQLAREQVVCGCHVHVGFDDPEDPIRVMNRVKPWLPLILALSSNSPFWMGEPTGYCSYRNRIWHRWPISGMPAIIRDRAEYENLLQTLLSTGSIDDPARIYWELRPSNKFNTLEVRIADVCMNVDDALLLAALIRALCESCYRQEEDGVPAREYRPELLQAAVWRAARFGTSGHLIDVLDERQVPAWDLISQMLDFVRPVLRHRGEDDLVVDLLGAIRTRGTGASRQSEVYERTGRLEDVVDLIIAETART